MRAMNARAGLVFCLSGIGLYGCTALLDLGDNSYLEGATPGAASSSSGSGTGGQGGGSVGTGGMGAGGKYVFDYSVGTEEGAPTDRWMVTLDSIHMANQENAVQLSGAAQLPASDNMTIAGDFLQELVIADAELKSPPKLMGNSGATPLNTLFIAQFDGVGKHVWSKAFLNAGAVRTTGIAASAFDDAYVVVGTFEGNTFSDGMISRQVDSTATNMFILKINHSDGSTAWSWVLGCDTSKPAGTMHVSPSGVDIDATGNIYVAANFDCLLTIPSPGNLSIEPRGEQDSAILKISPGNANMMTPGSVSHVINAASAGYDKITSIRLSHARNELAIAGVAAGPFNIGISETIGKSNEVFNFAAVVGTDFLASNSPRLSASSAHSSDNTMEIHAAAIAGDSAAANMYLAGKHTATFAWGDQQSGIIEDINETASFVMNFPLEFDLKNPRPLFSYGIGTSAVMKSDNDSVLDIAADAIPPYNIYLAGTFTNEFFLPGGAVHKPESSTAIPQAYIAKTSQDLGDAQWVKTFGPASLPEGQSIQKLYLWGMVGSQSLVALGTYKGTFRFKNMTTSYTMTGKRAFIINFAP